MTDSTTPNPRRAAYCSLAASLGLLLIAVAVVIPIIQGSLDDTTATTWIFTAGAVVCLAASLFTPQLPKSEPLSRRRWQRIEGWSSIIFCAAAAMLFLPSTTYRDWLAFTLAGAVLRIICFFRSFKPYK